MSDIPSFSIVINAMDGPATTSDKPWQTIFQGLSRQKPAQTPWDWKCKFRLHLVQEHAQENLDFHDSIRVYKKWLRTTLDAIPGADAGGGGVQERKSRHRKSLLAAARVTGTALIDFAPMLSTLPTDQRTAIEKQVLGLNKLLIEIQKRFLTTGAEEEVNLPGNVKSSLCRSLAQGIPEGKTFDEALACIESSLRGNWLQFARSQ